MKYLKFAVKDMKVAREAGDKTALITGAVNYFGIHFDFDEDFASIEGEKSVELFKNRTKKRIALVDGECLIPNDFLRDKGGIELRVLSGDTVATPWTSVGITESGLIEPEEPDEEIPDGSSYVKSPTGKDQVAQLREGKSGLEYTQDGSEWKNANGAKKEEMFVEKLKTQSDIAKKINEIIDVLAFNGILSETGANRISIMGQKDTVSYGNKPVSELMKPDVQIAWDGLNGKVTGTFLNVTGWNDLPKPPNEGHFFGMRINEKYKGKPFTFIKGSEAGNTVEAAGDDEMFWVLRIDENKKFTFKSGDEIIVTLDFTEATLDS